MDITNPAAEVREAECSLNDLRDQIKDHYGHYQRHQGFALNSAVEVGKCLLRVKARLQHGAFQTYVEKHFDFTARSARNYMRLAQDWQPKTESVSVLELDKGVSVISEDSPDKEVAPPKPVPFAGGTSAPPAPPAPARPTQTEPGEGADDELKERIFKALCKRCQRVGKPACDKCRVKAYRLTEGIEAHAKGKGPKKPRAPSANGQAVFDWTGLFDSIKVIAQAPDKLKRAYGDCPELHALDRLHKEYEENRLKILQTLQKRFT